MISSRTRGQLEELERDAVRIAEVGDARPSVGAGVDIDRAPLVDWPCAEGDGSLPHLVRVLDGEAEMDVAGVGGRLVVRAAVLDFVVEQLEQGAAGQIDERGLDRDAGVADMPPEVWLVERAAKARLDAEQRLPERE